MTSSPPPVAGPAAPAPAGSSLTPQQALHRVAGHIDTKFGQTNELIEKTLGPIAAALAAPSGSSSAPDPLQPIIDVLTDTKLTVAQFQQLFVNQVVPAWREDRQESGALKTEVQAHRQEISTLRQELAETRQLLAAVLPTLQRMGEILSRPTVTR